MAMFKKIITRLIVLAIVAATVYWGYNYWTQRQAAQAQMMAGGESGPIPMPVEKCIFQDITDTLDFTGTTEDVNMVEVRARVEGYLKGVHFTDGSLVEAGQLLFTIEPEMYQSLKEEAAARLRSGETELERSRMDMERIEKAVQSGSVSKQDSTSARAAFDTAQAQVMGYQASLDKAELDLSYTEIRSPIAGRIGRRQVDIGNLVGAGERTVLTTVRQIQPMYISFHISEHLLEGELLRRLRGDADAEPLTLSVGLPSQNEFPYTGEINFLDNTVDSRTGTVYVRGELPNESQELLPGMFVLVKVPIAERKNAILIPEKSISTDLGGKYILVVGKDNILERKNVKPGVSMGDKRIINEGLDGSEIFIVGGFHIARPGMPIIPLMGGQMPDGAGEAKE